ncbi:zinc-dependent MarR family transcriptional regulator [Streptococcus sp. DD13]|uniref:zinc-dependent MarR family transcriptional regulator n=1 Tax=Streptococcus sp. DD13 TaxID=1777881 RepID=UPI0007950477|nr:zinc-dependent MarR family transcriptional regulator [Streptococcus sp. DD13]KXT77625.1 Transcriptional repressor AdcR for Zn(2+)-responsive expression [Streptococcus sp. DD13]
MEKLTQKLDELFQRLILSSENQLEFLIGDCESGFQLTNTQEHILMLIERYHYTNSEIAKVLGISQAAVTKAIKGLLNQNLLESYRDERDGRMIHYRLTSTSKEIAAEHAHHHEKTLQCYQEILDSFPESEQLVIERFLNKLEGVVR